MSGSVLVIGSLNMDLVMLADSLPAAGETLFGRDFRMVPGGKGANQAVAAARLGAEACMAGRVGEDPFAKALTESLEASGVDTTLVTTDHHAATGVAAITVLADGRNTILVAPGANMRISPDDLTRMEPWFDRAAVVLLQFEIPLDVVDRALDLARAHGCRSVLDAGPAVKAPRELLAKATVLSPNEPETEALLGVSVATPDAARDAARRFRDMGVECVILKLGERGALLDVGDHQEIAPAFPVKPVDTTAAGDAFTGALGVAMAEDMDWPRAVRFANAAGALACRRPGAQPSLPTRTEVEEFMRRNG